MADTVEVPTGAISLQEVAFEHFQAFFESILEQAAFTPEQQAELGEQLKSSIEKRDKLGNVLMWLEGQAEMLKAKEKQLADRRKNFEKFHAAVVSSLHQQMLDWGVRKVEGQEFSFTVKKNPPKVEIVNEEALPAEFVKYVLSVDKAAIKDALTDGKEVAGAQLVQSTRLEIK